MKSIGYITTTVGCIVYGYILNGWALSTLWQWFIVPVFALPPLSLTHAVGVSIIVQYMTIKVDLDKPNKTFWNESLINGALIATVKPLLALATGWIVKLWM